MTETLNLLSWYIFWENPKSKLIRDALMKFQINLILYYSDVDLSAAEISHKSGASPACIFKLDVDFVDNIIKNAVHKTPPEIIENVGKFQLVPEKRSQLKKALDNYTKARQDFYCHVIKNIEDLGIKLDVEVSNVFSDNLDSLLISYFRKIVKELDRACSFPRNSMSYQFDKTQIEMFAEAIDNVLEKKLPSLSLTQREVIKDGVKNALSSVSEDTKRYLAAIHSKVFFSQFVVLDPNAIDIEKEMLKRRRIYFDTNVVIKGVFDGAIGHLLVKSCLENCKYFNIPLFVAPFTKEELRRQREKSKQHYYLFSQQEPWVLRWIKEGGADILRTFLRRKTKSMSISNFLSPYDPWEEYLFDKFSTLVEDEGSDEIKKHENYDIVRSRIKECKSYFAKMETIEHDTHLFILMHQLRKKYQRDEAGSIVWALTTDGGLVRKAQKFLHYYFPEPVFKLIDEWANRLAYLRIVEITGLTIENYVNIVANTQFGALCEDTSFPSAEFIDMIMNSKLPIDELKTLPPAHTQRALLRLQRDKEVIELIEKAIAKPKEKSKTDAKFKEKLLKAVHDEEETNVKMNSLGQELAIMRQKIGKISEILESKDDILNKKKDEIRSLKNIVLKEKTRTKKWKITAWTLSAVGLGCILAFLIYMFVFR